MPHRDPALEAKWNKLRPELLDAYRVLVEQMTNSASQQDLLDAYLVAKRLSAEAFQALLRANIPDQGSAWLTVRGTLEYEMTKRYGETLPDWARRIPYGSATHQELFSLLVARLGEPVPADFLRVVTADAVHAERRVRELRELGLDIVSAKVAGTDTYILNSLKLDASYISSLVANTIKANKNMGAKDLEALLRLVQ